MNQNEIDDFAKFFKKIGSKITEDVMTYRTGKYSRDHITYNINGNFLTSSYYSWYNECDIREHLDLKKTTTDKLITLCSKHIPHIKLIYNRNRKLAKIK